LKTKGKCSAVVLRVVFAFLLVAVLAFFLVGETIMPTENPTENDTCVEYDADWEWVLPDGERKTVTVPGQCDAKRGEIVRLETVLSQNQEDEWFCMRASQQDMRVYVGDSLRKEYTTVETRMFGDNSASAYVFFPVYDEDAGEVLAIELYSDSEYSGFINKIYAGEKNDIVRELISQSVGVLAVSFCMLILSTLIVLVGCVLHFVYKKRIDIVYLGIGTLILSCSMTSESNIRQFFLPNGSVASHVGFLLTILIPYPFMVYVSRLQKERYDRFYRPLAWSVMINFLVCTLLQVFGIVDLVDSTAIAYAIIIISVVIMSITICIDLINGRAGDYGEVLIGLVAMIIAALWETCLTFIPAIPYMGGIVLSIGLIILLLMAASRTARELLTLEKEKQVAIEANMAKANFLANMSHEIRTPINTIIGMNEMILRENQEASVRQYAYNVDHASKVLLKLVDDMLDYSKIESANEDIYIKNLEKPRTETLATEREKVSVEVAEKKANLYAPNARILVVDDNRMNLSVAGALLKRTGIILTMANSGTQCLDFCRRKKFDLILMDHMMPAPDGIETLHLLRQDSDSMNTDTNVIVLTANAVAGMKDMYLAEGFSDYLTKPIVAEQLESMIVKYLPKEKIESFEGSEQ
jgi:CheY-like chemotaxis protein